MPPQPLILNEADLAPFIDMTGAIACLRTAFERWTSPDVANIPRSRARPASGVLNLMGAVDGPAGLFGTKSYFAGPDGVTFHVCLYELRTRRLLAVLESATMSQVRTGAASGLATDLMARPDAAVLALIGTGRQAFTQAEAVLAVRPIREIRVFGRNVERREALARQLRERFGVEVRSEGDARVAIQGADIVSTITRASEPVVFSDWLSAGTHLNVAGANTPDRREVDGAIIRGCRMPVTDDREQAYSEASEFRDAAAAGDWDWSVVAELADVITGRVTPRRDAGELTLFKSLGIAFEDIAYADYVLKTGAAAGAWQLPN
jgi:ornithine cyclodeaminase/alanine dehydrogenase-like protein (mu-crystallin family)